MNAHKHAEISVQKRGGCIEDYYRIHAFMDATKELCSDNRHRILHNLWGVRRVIIPLFGPTITNSDGKAINVKDLCEQDHILPDYRNKFIPTLQDFVDAIHIDAVELKQLEGVIKNYQHDDEISKLLLSPLALTGELKSLLITHNSWFIYEVLPLLFKRKIDYHPLNISPALLFNHMKFELWMDNGFAYPSSAAAIKNIISNDTLQIHP